MIKRVSAFGWIIMLQVFCNISFSQNNCGKASLDSAEVLYSTGGFDECIERLENCLNKFNIDQRAEAYRLLAWCYLAIDSVNDADRNIENLLSLKENFEADSRDPERFRNELKRITSEPSDNIIYSVSKRNENIRLAPATTVVITDKELIQRGYNDLLDLLRDLPGFDISIYYGRAYGNVYQRGLRTDNTDHILLLINGVEDNDLWSNIADISQQYPITNIKRVEVIYGPASTMYGPNAFSGVINIVTKEPADYMKNGRSFGVQALAGYSSYNTKYLDVSTGFNLGIFSFSLTGRFYNSDRPDLSSQDLWDYDPGVYDTSPDDSRYMSALSIYDSARARLFYYRHRLQPRRDLYRISTGIDSIILTPKGASFAWNLDLAGYDTSINSHFKNDAHSSYIDANIVFGNFRLGLVYWAKNEGAGTSSTDLSRSITGTRWLPAHNNIYLNYTKRINDKLLLSILLNYKIHTIRNGSKITTYKNYGAGYLNLDSLVKVVRDSVTGIWIPAPVAPSWITNYYFEQSTQVRSELKFTYTQSSHFYLLGGIELRRSELPKRYLSSTSPSPEDSADIPPYTVNQVQVNEFGVYGQGRYLIKKALGLTLGARLDHNRIGQKQGFGYELSPRVVIDYSLKEWIFKAIYSKGIENASSSTKYSQGLQSNATLKTELMNNYEISASNKISDAFLGDIDFYYSNITDVVGPVNTLAPITNKPSKQNQNIGELKIKGVHANVYYKSKFIQAAINYSYTKARAVKDSFIAETTSNNIGDIAPNIGDVGDIAPHKLNVIVNYIFLKKFSANFRINCVDSKKVGPGTTVPQNKQTFPGYVIGNFALTAGNLWRGISLQFVCNNIFDKLYYSPGINTAAGIFYPDKILQMGRNFSFRIGYEF